MGDSVVVGSVIAGKYRVESVLGEGGMACVVEATNLELGQQVAIKMLLGEQNQTPEMMQRFRREARITAKLQGEHVTRVLDLGWSEENEPFIVMELLKGHDLQYELDSRGPLPIEEAVDFLMQACEGVAEAHAAGLVHRDLKPGNLFLTRRVDGTPLVKVLDFGISKVVDGSSSQLATQNLSGTPLYMSPEQIKSPKNVDARTDQHALGAILYTLLAGHPPFQDESTTALSVVIATQPPPRITDEREDVPDELEAALLKALAKEPGDRFPDLAAFARAIAHFGTESSANSLKSVTSTLGPPKVIIEGAPVSSKGRRGPTTGNLRTGQKSGNLKTGQRTGNRSNPGLKTVVSPHRKAKQRMRWFSVVAIAAGVAGGVFAFMHLSGKTGAPAQGPATAARPAAGSETQPAVATPEPSGAEPAPALTAAPSATAEPAASVEPAEAEPKAPAAASPPRQPRAPQGGNTARTPKTPELAPLPPDPRDIFGGGR